MKYIKKFNLINESKSTRPYISDILDILHDIDMVEVPKQYSQEIKFNIDSKLDDERILRVNIYGGSNKLIPLSVVDETIERLKDYLSTIGCKIAVKYYYRNQWNNNRNQLVDKILIGIRLNLYKMLQATYDDGGYILLLNDENTIVLLDKNMPRGNRTYYITFKKVDSNSQFSTLKFEYLVNSRDFINFKIHDNHGNKVDWNKLDMNLRKSGIDYGIFNNGFGYMESDFNNQTYTFNPVKKFFDI